MRHPCRAQAGEAYALMAAGKCGKVAVVFDEELNGDSGPNAPKPTVVD